MSESVLSIGQQSGMGIACEGATFRAAYIRRQRGRARVVDRLEIPEYRELGAAECGRRYREFLRKHGLKAPRTTVALGREAVLLRAVGFPGTVANELAGAVEYQLDSLHPFEDGEVYWDYAAWKWPEEGAWAKLTANAAESDGGRIETLVGIAARKGVEETAAWLDEAGIPVSQFGVKAALWIGMFWGRLQAAFPGAPALFLLQADAEQTEFVGYAPGRELVWQELGAGPTAPDNAGEAEAQEALAEEIKRELEQALAALRVSPQDRLPLIVCGSREPAAAWLGSAELPFQIVPAEQLLGSSVAGAEGLSQGAGWTELAAGLAAAGGGVSLPLNLLPAERRTYEPTETRWPTYALAALAAVLALALSAHGPFQDWLYSRRLEREMQAMQPQVREVEAAQTGAEEAQARLQVLSGARQSARAPLAVLNELTRILPQDVWLQQFTYDGETVNITGTAPAASGLLQTLAESRYFENPQFRTSISRTREGEERFTITARLRAGAAEGMRQ